MKHGEKKCFKCLKYKDHTEFYKDRTKRDGYISRCKECELVIYSRKTNHRKIWNKNNKDRIQISVIRYKEKYPEKHKARELVIRAIKKGDLERKPCQVCGVVKTHAHHEDYSKPLDVIFLCPLHHKELHFNRLVLAK